jgi:hypothetical protein
MQDSGYLQKEEFALISDVSPFGMPLNPSFMYEIMQPLLKIALRAESETMVNLCTESFKIIAFLA